MHHDFKEIKIDITGNLPARDIDLISKLFSRFSAEEIHYDLFPDKAVIYLYTLDFSLFRKLINIGIEAAQSQAAGDLLKKIFAEIRAIKSYGLKSGKRLYMGYNAERKVVNRARKEKKRGQFYYAADHNFSTEHNPVPADAINRIHCTDSQAFLTDLPDNCIDLIFTSPPYNFGLDYRANADDHKWEKYFDKLFAIFSQCIRVLKFGGRIIVNIQPLFSDYIPSHHFITQFFTSNKLIWKGEILWEKNNYNCKYTAWGSWKSPGNPYLKYTWEFLEVFCKGSLKKEGDRDKADITGDEFKNWVYGKWSIAPEKKMKQYGHPAMFPQELVRRGLKLFSFAEDIILDPFNGAGTTTYVAKTLNRRYIGVDVSEEYCRVARERLAEVLL